MQDYRGTYGQQTQEELRRIRSEMNNEPPMELRMFVLEERSPVAFITNVFRYKGTVFSRVMPALISITILSSVLAILRWHLSFQGFDPTLDGVLGASRHRPHSPNPSQRTLSRSALFQFCCPHRAPFMAFRYAYSSDMPVVSGRAPHLGRVMAEV
jgi:hypothetical protein